MLKFSKRQKVLLSAFFVIMVLVGVGAVWLSEASINYGFNYDYIYQKDGDNWFTLDDYKVNRTEGMLVSVECYNVGLIDGTFTIAIEFTNASFSSETSQPYFQLNNSTVELPITLHGGEHRAVDVYFTVDNSATSFGVKVSFESHQVLMRSTEGNPHGINTMYYTKNEAGNSFSIPSLAL